MKGEKGLEIRGGGVAGEEEKEGGEGVGCQERRKQDTNKYPKRETRQ